MRPPGQGAGSDADQEVLGLARGGGANLIGAAFSQLTLLGISVLLARKLGRAEIGIYTQAFAFLSLLGLLALSGFRAGMTRYVAVHLADGDEGALRGTVRLGIGISLAAGVTLGGALFLAAPWVADSGFGDPRIATPLRYVGLTLPVATFMETALAATQGYRTMRPFAVIALVVEPAVRLALSVAFVWIGAGVSGAAAALLVSNLLGAVLAGVALRRLMGSPSSAPVYRPRQLLTFSTASWMASLTSTGLIWADTIILGVYRSSADVGVYSAATRLVVLATFVMAPINASFAPRIADLHRRGRTDTLRRTYGVATSWIVRLSLPSFIVLVLFPGELLRVFGSGFGAGATVTVLLAFGKLIDAGTGPCGLMINMSGRSALNMLNNLAALGLNIGLNIVLIPRHGIVGAATAWAVSLALVNLARVVEVRVLMGILPFDVGVMKGVVAGAFAFAVAVGARQLIEGTAALLVAAPLLLGVYVGVMALLGVDRDDRLVLRMLARRGAQGAVGRGPSGGADQYDRP